MAHTTLTRDVAHVRLRERLGQHPYWTALDLHDALTLAVAIWHAATQTWTRRVVVPVIGGDPFVPVAGLEQVLSVRWEGYGLLPTSTQELAFMRPQWRTDVAGLPGVPSRPMYWAPVGDTLVVIWPPSPRTSALACDGLQTPAIPSLIGPDGPLDLSEDHAPAVLDLAAWWAAGSATPQEQDKHSDRLDRALDAAQSVTQDKRTRTILQDWIRTRREIRGPVRAEAEP